MIKSQRWRDGGRNTGSKPDQEKHTLHDACNALIFLDRWSRMVAYWPSQSKLDQEITVKPNAAHNLPEGVPDRQPESGLP
jgi:hypothetical protein